MPAVGPILCLTERLQGDLLGSNGGSVHRAQMESVLRATAEDFGKRGKDLHFGHGQVSAD